MERIKTGRILRPSSLPTVGSRSAHQTSPRRGTARCHLGKLVLFAREIVQRLPVGVFVGVQSVCGEPIGVAGEREIAALGVRDQPRHKFATLSVVVGE